jgi:hypothetical protein
MVSLPYALNPDTPKDQANRGDFYSGELRLTHKASLCVPPINIVHDPHVLFAAKMRLAPRISSALNNRS